jgi:nucleoid-associated protein YgaU
MVLIRAMKGRFVTANESETSAIQNGARAPEAAAEDEERWLTYLNYDQPIQQAVRRLGALSAANVDVFRRLFLNGRDRSRVKEYEAESIRRLQGEAFVGDEELQRTLIVLTAEDPRFGEELKKLVAASGKPAQLDQAVAAIRSGKTEAAKPADVKPADKVEPVKPKEPVREAVVVPLRKEQAAPAPKPIVREAPREIMPAPQTKPVIMKLAVVGGLILVVAVGALFLTRGPGDKASDRQAETVPQAEKPQSVASSAPRAPAPAVDIAMPAQADKTGSASAAPASPPSISPPLRPAATQPDVPAQQASAPATPASQASAINASAPQQQDSRAAPVPGSTYKVVRGDMLSDIALQAYGDASKFRLIQAANPGIHNKDHILVDQMITIPQIAH